MQEVVGGPGELIGCMSVIRMEPREREKIKARNEELWAEKFKERYMRDEGQRWKHCTL
jgi:hypothetical protein